MGNLLFSGDNIFKDSCVGVIDAHHGSDIPAFLESLRRIQGDDAEFLLPSHGPVFRRDPAILQKAIDRLTQYQFMADFGTCATSWPLLDEWEKEVCEGRMPDFSSLNRLDFLWDFRPLAIKPCGSQLGEIACTAQLQARQVPHHPQAEWLRLTHQMGRSSQASPALTRPDEAWEELRKLARETIGNRTVRDGVLQNSSATMDAATDDLSEFGQTGSTSLWPVSFDTLAD